MRGFKILRSASGNTLKARVSRIGAGRVLSRAPKGRRWMVGGKRDNVYCTCKYFRGYGSGFLLYFISFTTTLGNCPMQQVNRTRIKMPIDEHIIQQASESSVPIATPARILHGASGPRFRNADAYSHQARLGGHSGNATARLDVDHGVVIRSPEAHSLSVVGFAQRYAVEPPECTKSVPGSSEAGIHTQSRQH